MGIFKSFINLFKKNKSYEVPWSIQSGEPRKQSVSKASYVDASSIAPDERKYYQPDDYYTYQSYPGTAMGEDVVTFEKRKETCYPSERGLYVGEILLLDYCKRGKYPNPKDGYPGFWWFQYGIRDVGKMLKSLEARGFIQLATPRESINSLKVPELKALLREYKAPVSGRKNVLVERVKAIVPDEALAHAKVDCKYQLTTLGEKELADNAYVPYMHKVPYKTNELGPEDTWFNVWRINKELGIGDKSNWKKIVDKIEKQVLQQNTDKYDEFMENLKAHDRSGYEEIKAQDDQIAAVNAAEDAYKRNEDLDALIDFWEQLWSNGGLKFQGAYWLFRLPDLYIKIGRYEDALRLCKRIKKAYPNYGYKADDYFEKIEKKMNKSADKK